MAKTSVPVYWVMDLANTRTKLAPVRAGKLGRVRRVSTDTLTIAGWRKFLPPDSSVPLVLASVVPHRAKRLAKLWRGEVFQVRGGNVPGLEIDYPKPDEIGADRLANALAAKTLYGSPVVVMDFGTGFNIEVVNGSGAFCGGAIAPGWDMLASALAEKTAQLPLVELKRPRAAIARSTGEAIRSGCYHGFRGMIRELLAAMQRELGSRKLRVIVTGGQGARLAEGMAEVTAVNPLLTLEGLRIMGASLYGKSN